MKLSPRPSIDAQDQNAHKIPQITSQKTRPLKQSYAWDISWLLVENSENNTHT